VSVWEEQKAVRLRVYEDLFKYYQDLIPPGGSIGRSELLARLQMLAEENR
jgi:hypothetical protein